MLKIAFLYLSLFCCVLLRFSVSVPEVSTLDLV